LADAIETNRARKRRLIRMMLLLLAVLSSPLACYGSLTLLSALIPPILSPGAIVENRTGETLYLTPITTMHGRPEVIRQTAFIRQCDIPLEPNRSIALTHDASDMPLSGIAACRTDDDCRLLAIDYSQVHNLYYLDSYEDLPRLNPNWLLAIRSHNPYDFGIVLFPALGLVPVVLFLRWAHSSRLENRRWASKALRRKT
jgi:hypothetical protein